MNPLYYAVIGVGLAAIVATIYAVMSAQDGYEDATGFHGLDLDEAGSMARTAKQRAALDEDAIHPYVPRPLS